jgi:hypothetical protein
LALYRAPTTMIDTDLLGASPFTIDASVLTASNSLVLSNSTTLNFLLGTNASEVAVAGRLTLNAQLNVTNGGGFAAGTFTLFTYVGSLSGTPTLGNVPANYTCSLNTSTPKKVLLEVQTSPPTQASFGHVTQSGGKMVMSGAGGPLNGTYYVLTSTNLSLPLTNWTRVLTNAFDTFGNFSFTNASGSNSQGFYLLQQSP